MEILEKNFPIGAMIKVVLNGQHFYNAYGMEREVILLEKPKFEVEFGLTRLEGIARVGRIKELGWMEIPHSIVGTCAGYHQKVLKLKPMYGIMGCDGAYFVISTCQIKTIGQLIIKPGIHGDGRNAGYSRHFFLYKHSYVINIRKVNILYKQAVCCLRKSAESRQFFCYFSVWVYT